jgi:hypothetical protein
MPRITIPELKERQDRVDDRKKDLVANFIPFRNNLIQNLDQFIGRALESELRGVTELKVQREGVDCVEGTFSLHHLDLLLVASSQVWHRTLELRILAVKVFLSRDFEGKEEPRPVIKVVFEEDAQHTYACDARRLSENQPERVLGRLAIKKGPDQIRYAGREVVKALIAKLCGFEHAWPERPTLHEVRIGASNSVESGL